MGQLTFQATLGGATNIIGPNISATNNFTLPSADGSSGQVLQTNGSGALSFSGVSLTSGVSGVLPVANGGTGLSTTPANGALNIGNGTGFTRSTLTAGAGVTITNGAGSITIAASGGSNSTPIGTDLSSTAYSVTTSTGVGTVASSGVYITAVAIDATREMLFLYFDASIHAVVWDNTAQSFGTPVLVRTATFSVLSSVATVNISSSAILLCTLPSASTALETVVLSVSGTTITVNTAVATTLAAASSLIAADTRLITVGTSYVLTYVVSSVPNFRAITVSGTTPTVGSQLAYSSPGASAYHASFAYNSTTLMTFANSGTTIYGCPISVSGTTLTLGTQAARSADSLAYTVGMLSTGRFAVACISGTNVTGAIFSVTGTVATVSSVTLFAGSSATACQMQIFNAQAFILTLDNLGVLTDVAGVATTGTQLTPAYGNILGYLSTGKIFTNGGTVANSKYYQYGLSGNNPVLEKTFPNNVSTSSPTYTIAPILNMTYTYPLSGPTTSNSGTTPIAIRTSSGKTALASYTGLPFICSIDGTNMAKLQQNPFMINTAYNSALSTAVAWGVYSTPTATTVPLVRIQIS